MTTHRPNTHWLRHILQAVIPLPSDETCRYIEAAYLLAHRCSVCGGKGAVYPSETGASGRYTMRERSCFHCDGHGLTWPTSGLTLDPRHVRELAATLPPLDQERASALAGVDRALQRAIENTPAVETQAAATLPDDSRRGVQIPSCADLAEETITLSEADAKFLQNLAENGPRLKRADFHNANLVVEDETV